MARIVELREVENLLSRKNKGRIVLTGGCFDILHVGHVRFLSEAKKLGDTLVVLLESDENVKKLKGKNRPVFIQKERAEMLSALRSVDFIVLLPMMESDGDYSDLVMRIKPDIIVLTERDPLFEKKKEQAKKVGGELKVVSLTETYSTSKLGGILGLD